jgi:hypothetical protein
MAALHSLTAELHAGFLTLAFACIVAVALAQIIVRMKGCLPRALVALAIKVRGYAEAAGYVGAVAGIVGLLLSAWTGMYAWPQDALLESAVIRNKITLTLFATVLWGGVVFIRMRFGRGLWTCPAMAFLYTALAVVAYGVLGMTGSLGAHLTVGESVLDPLWNLIGVDVNESLAIEPGLAVMVALVCVVALVAAMFVARRLDLFGVELGPECERFFKWDEPTISTEAVKEE